MGQILNKDYELSTRRYLWLVVDHEIVIEAACHRIHSAPEDMGLEVEDHGTGILGQG
jgi:hypothetical protein